MPDPTKLQKYLNSPFVADTLQGLYREGRGQPMTFAEPFRQSALDAFFLPYSSKPNEMFINEDAVPGPDSRRIMAREAYDGAFQPRPEDLQGMNAVDQAYYRLTGGRGANAGQAAIRALSDLANVPDATRQGVENRMNTYYREGMGPAGSTQELDTVDEIKMGEAIRKLLATEFYRNHPANRNR